ncbi:N-acetylglucosamine-1-phosphotransferase subunits alpha/beta-like isoform X2 [Atheta coriaria]
MPWIRHVYIVTNGQVPSWLNLEAGHVTIITHEQIFANRSHLPTFSSPAIETNLHRIPGISKRFLYMNDDLLIGAPVEFSTFYTPTDGQLFYWHSKMPNCALLCPWSKVGNGRCDHACYTPECQMDGGDCPVPPHLLQYSVRVFQFLPTDAYGLSIQTTQQLLNRKFGYHERYVTPHMPFLLDVDVMQDAWNDFPIELSNTSSHRFRDASDIQFQIFYAFYTYEKQTILSLKEILHEHDVNQNSMLDNEEVNWMIVKHYKNKSRPNQNDTHEFRNVLRACILDDTNQKAYNTTQLEKCELFEEFLKTSLRSRRKFKSMFMTRVPPNGFYMFAALKSQLDEIISILNDLKREPRKFICLNDDLTHTPRRKEVNQQIYKQLGLFYRGMFPKPSKYELPNGEVNPPGKYIDELLSYNSKGKQKSEEELVIKKYYWWVQCTTLIALIASVTLICIVRHGYKCRESEMYYNK